MRDTDGRAIFWSQFQLSMYICIFPTFHFHIYFLGLWVIWKPFRMLSMRDTDGRAIFQSQSQSSMCVCIFPTFYFLIYFLYLWVIWRPFLHAFDERHWWQSYFLITISIVYLYLHISYFSFPHLLPLPKGNLKAVLHDFDERHWWQSYFLITISIVHVYLHISYFLISSFTSFSYG